MPTYDYRCSSCGHRFEARQSFNDDPIAACPTCGERSERLITAVAVHFKGSGFYKTDYGSGNGKPSNGDGKTGDTKADAAKADAPSTASKDSSPADKPAEKPAKQETAKTTE